MDFTKEIAVPAGALGPSAAELNAALDAAWQRQRAAAEQAGAEVVIESRGGGSAPAWRTVSRAAPSARSVQLGEQLGELEDLGALKAWLRACEQAAAAGNIARSEYVRLLEAALVVESGLVV